MRRSAPPSAQPLSNPSSLCWKRTFSGSARFSAAKSNFQRGQPCRQLSEAGRLVRKGQLNIIDKNFLNIHRLRAGNWLRFCAGRSRRRGPAWQTTAGRRRISQPWESPAPRAPAESLSTINRAASDRSGSCGRQFSTRKMPLPVATQTTPLVSGRRLKTSLSGSPDFVSQTNR